ncbi:hypothetical protein ATEIFO6365_0015000700 [Aspergillus terreus]|uniref:Uncharacterized protein n=1 Tax=Aspergillus terreus TaxID=33178 RepID=A0A5M3ZGV2_ASPTE|nr:hypothetical protein ATETN484_0016000700 [Aspergillus terreus]GFF21436.1 hypothetical protein ATEIFO6365_0015000700 [Aspergillus terreus]
MDYKITIKNKASPDRSYCIVAQPPTVDNIDKSQLLTPVVEAVGPTRLNDKNAFTFNFEYFAFVGTENTKANGRKEIDLKNFEPIKLASERENGSIIETYFAPPEQFIIRKSSDEVSDAGAFKIACGENGPPRGSRHNYIVGLAIRWGNEADPIPIAAMPFQVKKDYCIAPSGIMCVGPNYPILLQGEVVDSKKMTFAAIQFPRGANHVKVFEDNREDFFMEGSEEKLPKGSLVAISQGQSQAYQIPRFDHEPRKAKHAAKVPPKWLTEAEAAGLSTRPGYHDVETLKVVARNAEKWSNKIAEDDNLSDEFLDDLLVLALFDCIIFLDNSQSINWDEDRSAERLIISETIVAVEATYDNTRAVRIEFLNGPFRGEKVSTPEELTQLLENIDNYGKTPLGTELEAKILKNYVYPKLEKGERFRPVLITVITDGDPQGEPRDAFKKKLQYCEALLRDKRKTNLIGDKHVLFQISRVGNDRRAASFIDDLRKDKDLKGVLHCTSYQNIDINPEADDPIDAYAPAIRRLAGAAFVGLERNEKGRFKFLDN